jgi:hypothetical protein
MSARIPAGYNAWLLYRTASITAPARRSGKRTVATYLNKIEPGMCDLCYRWPEVAGLSGRNQREIRREQVIRQRHGLPALHQVL